MRKNYRFSAITVKRLEERNQELYPSETEFIEEAIARFVTSNQMEEQDVKIRELECRIEKLEKENSYSGFNLDV